MRLLDNHTLSKIYLIIVTLWSFFILFVLLRIRKDNVNPIIKIQFFIKAIFPFLIVNNWSLIDCESLIAKC